MNNILIVSPARCGSSWVQTTLQRSLNLKYVNDFNNDNYKNYSAEDIVSQSTPWIGKLFTDEIEIYQKDLSWWEQYADIIYLYRQDLLDHFLSFAFATSSRVFNSESDVKHDPIQITSEDYDLYANIWKKFTKIVPTNTTIFTYETMQSDVHNYLHTTPADVDMRKLLTYEQKCALLNTPVHEIEQQLINITGIQDLRNYTWQY